MSHPAACPIYTNMRMQRMNRVRGAENPQNQSWRANPGLAPAVRPRLQLQRGEANGLFGVVRGTPENALWVCENSQATGGLWAGTRRTSEAG